MKVIYDIKKFPRKCRRSIVAIGVFDGVHKGHQTLIKSAVQRARALKIHAVVMTFHPHPVNVLHPEVRLPLIVSLSYRLKLIEDLGVDTAIVIRFTKNFSHLRPENFIKHYLVNPIQPREIFVGDDFRFGQNRTGTVDLFKNVGEQYGFSVKAIHPIKRKGETVKISSTTIRQWVSEGQLKQAQRLLGRPVSMMGRVIKGDGRGKMLGFPTANILPYDEIFVPIGVYAVHVIMGDHRYQGMANVGRRPSFKNDGQITIEVHIFDFHQNIYGQDIIIEFIKKIRPEKIFFSHQEFISQLQKDQKTARNLLR